MQFIKCYAYAEDSVSCEVIRKLVDYQQKNTKTGVSFDLRPGFPDDKKGYGNIKRILPNIRAMAKNSGMSTIILTDLDRATCAPKLIRDWFKLKEKHPKIPNEVVFRIAEREVESWLLADKINLAKFLNISSANFPQSPDEIDDPKQVLLNLIKSKCRKKIHKLMLPSPNSHVGTEYNPQLCKFVKENWDISAAAKRSRSLQRTVNSLLSIAKP